jgi:hypothetical protein
VLYRRDDGDFGLIEPIVGGAYGPGSAQAATERPARAG